MIQYGIDIPNYLECLPNTLYVEDIEYGVKKLSWGFEIPAEKMDSNGDFIRPRWAKVLWKADNIKDINVGEYCLLKHGHWSSSIEVNVDGEAKKIWYISPKSFKEGLLAKSITKPKCLELYGL